MLPQLWKLTKSIILRCSMRLFCSSGVPVFGVGVMLDGSASILILEHASNVA